MDPTRQRKVLIVGQACLDIVNVCEKFPVEDLGHRAVDARWQVGGKAAVAACVLADLFSGTSGVVEFCGVFGNDCQGQFLINKFKKSGVFVENCEVGEGCVTPTSTVIIDGEQQTTTILRCNTGQAEVSYVHFENKFISRMEEFDWIHFDGTNPSKMFPFLKEIMTRLVDQKKPIISVQFETLNSELPELIDLVNILFISKSNDSPSTSEDSEVHLNQIFLYNFSLNVVHYTAKEVWAASKEEVIRLQDPTRKNVVDNYGAEDIFVGAFIFAKAVHGLKETLDFARSVAVDKCGQIGYMGSSKR